MSNAVEKIGNAAVTLIMVVIFGLVLVTLHGGDPSAYTDIVQVIISAIVRVMIVAMIGVVFLKLVWELIP